MLSINDKDLKFKVRDCVRISKYKKKFRKELHPKLVRGSLCHQKLKLTVPWIYIISGLKGEEIVETFYEKQLQKTNQKEFRIEKVIKKISDKLYIK